MKLSCIYCKRILAEKPDGVDAETSTICVQCVPRAVTEMKVPHLREELERDAERQLAEWVMKGALLIKLEENL